jgi:hypothetical protein
MLANHQLNFPGQPRVHTGIAMLGSAVAAGPAMCHFLKGGTVFRMEDGFDLPFYQMVGAVRFELVLTHFTKPLKTQYLN